MNLTPEYLATKLNESRVPSHMHDGLILWLTEGIPPGSFLSAVLCNDLSEAAKRADDTNRWYRLYDFIDFLYNYAPVGSWGSTENARRWAELHNMRRNALRAEGGAK